MEKKMFLCRLKTVLVSVFVCSFAFTAAAQNYYPAEVGNTWVLENSDADEKRTYSLEDPETLNGTEVITLKIETEKLSTGELDTDKYFLTVGNEAIKLHGTVLEEGNLGVVTADFPTPATFFPLNLTLGDKWQIVAEAKVKSNFGLTIGGKSTTNLEVVAFETLETPAGTFDNCAKVELALTFSAGFINVDSTTYQWLAPDVGPVQYQNSDGLIFKLVSTNLPTEPDPHDVNADGVVDILDLTFVAARLGKMDAEADVNGDGTVNILDLVRIAQNFSN